MKKKLSKQEKFDLELIYKPLFSTVSSIELSSFKDDKVMGIITERDILRAVKRY